MNRERRKTIANIFADAAKYTLTAGAVGSLLSGKISLFPGMLIGISFIVFMLLAYFLTPKDTKEE